MFFYIIWSYRDGSRNLNKMGQNHIINESQINLNYFKILIFGVVCGHGPSYMNLVISYICCAFKNLFFLS